MLRDRAATPKFRKRSPFALVMFRIVRSAFSATKLMKEVERSRYGNDIEHGKILDFAKTSRVRACDFILCPYSPYQRYKPEECKGRSRVYPSSPLPRFVRERTMKRSSAKRPSDRAVRRGIARETDSPRPKTTCKV